MKLNSGKEIRVTDANVYWLPDELFEDPSVQQAFVRAVPKEYDVSAIVDTLDDGRKAIKIEKPKGCENLNYFEGDYDLDHQLADMEKGQVDFAVMKLPGCQEWLNLELCHLFNDKAAEFSKRSHGKMIPLAVVPPFGDDACLKELDRCIDELGMHGVQVSAHYGNHYLDDEMFRGFFKHCNERKIPVYVHHTPLPVDYGSLIDYNNLRRSFGRCQDQITAIGRELFSGMFRDLPDLKMIHSMLGGAYFAFQEMLMPRDSGGGRFQVAGDDVRGWLKNNIYFEVSHSQPWGKTLLETAVKVSGADHIIYGSSYPVKTVWMTEGASVIDQMDITDEEKEEILYGNAHRIYGAGQ